MMLRKSLIPAAIFMCMASLCSSAADEVGIRSFSLADIRQQVHQNRSIIIGALEDEMSDENLSQARSERLPQLQLSGNGYYSNTVPLTKEIPVTNAFMYDVNLYSEIDIYAGGIRKNVIERMKKEKEISANRYESVFNDVELKAFLLLYDIYRNMKYRDFINSSIQLREKEYERIVQLYENGLVLKSDLLRSKLYITDLQRDEVSIANSIKILSDRFCVLLGIEERFDVIPSIDDDLGYAVTGSLDEITQFAYANSPDIKALRSSMEREGVVLDEIRSENIPHLKAYARYGIGSPQQNPVYHHQLGGEVGVKLSFDIGSFYRTKHDRNSQKIQVTRHETFLKEGEEKLADQLLELYTRYQESLINIKRAEEKIEMSRESTRILRNSYYNQQSLLIDVLESETQSMEASFEWVQAIVDSQKYYWALRYISGNPR